MPERTLSMIVEGEDQASAAMASAENSVVSLGSTVDGVGSQFRSFAAHVEAGRRELEAISSGAGSASSSLGGVTTDVSAAGVAAGSAGMDMRTFTSTLTFLGYSAGISRRGVMMFTRGIRLAGSVAQTAIRNLSTVGQVILGIGAAGAVGGIALGYIASALANLAKRSVEAEDKRVDFEEWTADAGGHVLVLGQLREATGGLTSDLALQEEATEAITRSVKDLMAADYLLTEADARRLALMEYDRKLIQDAVARGDRLGDSYVGMTADVDNLADAIGQNLTPALDSVGAIGEEAVGRAAPSLESLAESIADWFTGASEKGPALATALGDIVTVLATLADYTLTPFKYRIEFIEERVPTFFERLGEIFAPRGVGISAPMYAPGGAGLPSAPYREAPQDVTVSGVIDVNVNVSGDLSRVGAEIGRGIQGELRRIGMG